MGSNVTHTKIVHGQWDCAPFWFANEKVDVGDFGTIDNKCFKRGRHKNELQGSCRQESRNRQSGVALITGLRRQVNDKSSERWRRSG